MQQKNQLVALDNINQPNLNNFKKIPILRLPYDEWRYLIYESIFDQQKSRTQIPFSYAPIKS
jgi:hypothetical protein